MSINKNIIRIASGSANTLSQVFYNSAYVDLYTTQSTFFSYNKPQFYTYGGTLNYYSQDPHAIFTNLVNPPIRFVITANTESLSGNSYFIHDIYKLDYDVYKLYSDNQISDSKKIENNADYTGAASNSISRSSISSKNVKAGNNIINLPEKLFGQTLTNGDISTIQNYLNTPVLTITAATSGMSEVYDLVLEQYAKQLGSYKIDLFTDKAQYFINTRIVFYIDLNKDYTDYYKLNSQARGSTTSKLPWNNTLQIIDTNSTRQVINAGPFAGVSVAGNYFTYFTVPDKPVLEYPIMSGQLSTFTPEFIWSNGDSADSFILQVDYNTSDTGFTGTVYNYPIEKVVENAKLATATSTFESKSYASQKTLYTYQASVRSNSNFIYRIGNSKELIDIFNVRRVVVTFSEYYSATTQAQPIRTYVLSESDSPYVMDIAGLLVPPSLDYESPDIGAFILSGTVSGSTVTGATMQLALYPNSNFITTTTDLFGSYSFSGLAAGTYTLTTNYRGYLQDVRTINLSSDTTLGFKLKLLWGNSVDTWGKMASESYYT